VKVSPTANYTVRVLRQEWEETPEAAHLYAGIFAVALNYTVDVSFVPDVSSLAPPWNSRALPGNLDEVTTPEQARLATALLSSYVVTPNEALAGTEERFTWEPDTRGVIFYVTPEEFDHYSGDLGTLIDPAGRLYSEARVADLRGHDVIAFLERRVVGSSLLAPEHADMLGQAR
jgi:hypothetical protein